MTKCLRSAGPDALLVPAAMAFFAALLARGAPLHSPTYDEPVHLLAGLRHLQAGKFDLSRGNPPLADAVGALPVAFMEPRMDWASVEDAPLPEIIRRFGALDGDRLLRFTTAARWACLPFGLLGGLICYLWARELYGRASGLFALALWCSCPSVLAHGQLFTGDMAATALGLSAFYAFWRWLRLPTAGRAAWAGLALGLAELSKFVWVILYPLWPLLWIAWRAATKEERVARGEVLQALAILALSVAVINVGYGFAGSLHPLGSFRAGQSLLGWPGAVAEGGGAPSPGGLAGWIASIPVPLPSDYLGGMEEIEAHYQTSDKQSYLRGEWRPGGWWYYYPYGLFVKTPLGTWLVLGLACASSLAGRRSSGDWRDEMLLLVPVASILYFVTSVTTVQAHIRYVLPVLPLLFVFASKALWGRAFSFAAAAGLAWSVSSSLWAYPHSLSYFNELAGGPMRGHDHLVDSNIAWGQDLLFLKGWLSRHPEAKPLYLADFGRVDPTLLGIDSRRPPGLRRVASGGEGPPEPGWYAVDVNYLHRRGYERFLHRRPSATAGYSIYIYHLEGPEGPRGGGATHPGRRPDAARLERGMAPSRPGGPDRSAAAPAPTAARDRPSPGQS
jgi:hypothetical protein